MRDMGIAAPGRGEFGAEGDQHKNPQGLYAVDEEIKHLQRRGIDPVDVLVDGEHRLDCGKALKLVEEDLERALFLPLRAVAEVRIAPLRRDSEQRRDQRHRFGEPLCACGNQSLKLAELGLGRVVAREARRALQEADHRVERAVGVMRRAVVAERRVRLVAQAPAQGPEHARLADPGLAREQHHLAVAIPGPGPALQ
jgi:hypothetical protein